MEIINKTADRIGLKVGHDQDNYKVLKFVGKGSFGKAFCVLDTKTKSTFVSKEIDLKKRKADDWYSEMAVHGKLKHPNVIEYRGCTTRNAFLYVNMELAACSLEDKIDQGLDVATSRRYFQDLIAGIGYMHSSGFAHRDIKPANLLVGFDDRLKIADFGLASEITGEFKGFCGTESFVAPEVLQGVFYQLEPADVWSCGIVLVAMMTDQLPWKVAEAACFEYLVWIYFPDIECHPFDQMDAIFCNLIRAILHDNPRKRATIADIKGHTWFNGH